MLDPSTTTTAEVPLGKALQPAPTELPSSKLLYVCIGQLPGVKDAQSTLPSVSPECCQIKVNN